MSVCCVKRLPQRPDEQAIWTNCYFRKLANLYRKSPCLWKKDEKNYLKSERRHRAYARIHRAMNLPCVTLVEIVLKIREMRRLYVNELKRLLQAEESGEYCCAISLPWFYDLHRFLYPYLDYDEAIELHGRSCEFKILGLGGATSSSNSYDTQSDQLEAFSKIVAHCLKKLGKPYAEEAQVEIQQVLENMLNKSRCNSPCNKACEKNLPP